MPSRKAGSLTLGSRDTVHRYLLSVAIILCNKMDFSFGASGHIAVCGNDIAKPGPELHCLH